ncbi:MAG: bifunctional pyr operon transcriptional regulator/uracil phosphoribosyltransferase PyrR [Propionibacteriaceae bacterium]|nr:bifunctional pyr operon transcriptional regulator/uracil phosphoribosyltransferase PyrR [Propionibacteriaceae bacterium]
MGASYLMSDEEVSLALTRMTHEVVELNHGKDFLLMGIITRGVPLANRIGSTLGMTAGELDITMYRDDLRRNPTRAARRSKLPESIDDKVVVLVDDVLFSGRTVNAALAALADLGRPRRVQLVTLVDRGHRELPIQADVVGRRIPTSSRERIVVHLQELDGEDAVLIESSN